MTNSKQPANKPIFRKQLPGGISAAVFENTRDGKTYRSVNLQRSYRHNGKWNRMSIYLDHQDIPFMIEVLNGVWRYLNEFPAGTASENDGEPAEAGDTVDETSPADA
jgi:hypothetical protein